MADLGASPKHGRLSFLYRNPAAIFVISMTLGLTFPGPATHLRDLISIALIVMMTFSLTGIDLRARGSLREAALGFIVNYLLLSGLILGLAWGIDRPEIWYGFVVMAAVPPAVSVVPLTKLLGGDVRLALSSTAACYLAALVMLPGIIFAFTSRTGVSFTYTFGAALAFILIPMILSRPARKIPIDPILPINLGFFLVTYTVIGLNSTAILEMSGDLALIAFSRTFLTGIAVYLGAALLGVAAEKRAPYTLLGSYKNLGLAAVVSIVLFGPEAAVPSGVCILAENAYYIFLYIAVHVVPRRGSLI